MNSISKPVLFVLLAIFVLGAILLSIFLLGGETSDESDQVVEDNSSENLVNFAGFFCSEEEVNLAVERAIGDFSGEINYPAMQIESYNAYAFNLNQVATDQFNKCSKVGIQPGNHVFVFWNSFEENDDPTLNIDGGLGFAPNGNVVLNPGDPTEIEPILQYDNRYAVFGSSDGWQESSVLDVANSFQFVPTTPAGFYSMKNAFGIVFPIDDLVIDEKSGKITLQLFGRVTPEGDPPSVDDPTGAFGTRFDINFQDPQSAQIFTDGFQTGNTSEWSSILIP